MNQLFTFSTEQLERYARHFALPHFGQAAQQKLIQSSVLVIGAGGLGAPVLLYLAAAGVGRLGIVEFDQIDLSNLQRQILYNTQDVGQSKAHFAANRVRQLNPEIKVDVHDLKLSSENALRIFSNYDVVVDGTDNFPTRYLANDAAVLMGIPYIYGSIFRYEGQVAVFNAPLPDGTRSMNYRNLYPHPPHPDLVPNCAEGGVLGVLPGIIGSMQANEAIKVLTGTGEPLIHKLFLFDAATCNARTIGLPPQPPAKVDQLIDYDFFCQSAFPFYEVTEISSKELQKQLKSKNPPILVDVREPYEREQGHIGGYHIPVGQIPEAFHLDVPPNQSIVFYCQTGKRSAKAIRKLADQWPDHSMYSLLGGLQNWK